MFVLSRMLNVFGPIRRFFLLYFYSIHMISTSSYILYLLNSFHPFRYLSVFVFFFFNDPATPEIYPLSLPDALPIPRLADAALRVGARHDVPLALRHPREPQHPIVVEVALLHATPVDRDLAPQRRREAVHDRALHLRLDGVGVDDRSTVHCAHHAMYVRGAVGVDRDLGDLGDVGLECLVNGDPPTASCREWRAPTRPARREVQHREVARRLAEQVAAVLLRGPPCRPGHPRRGALPPQRV